MSYNLEKESLPWSLPELIRKLLFIHMYILLGTQFIAFITSLKKVDKEAQIS